jgi:hypothetical protein
MIFRYYHTPPKSVSNRVRCPVCHEDVYSRGDVHPQCAYYRAISLKSKDERNGVRPHVDVGGAEVVEPPTVEPIPVPVRHRTPARSRMVGAEGLPRLQVRGRSRR